MRILAIRGENLASLADRFEIDFEAAPLRSSGLFVVTGETGAGKSTILDALCLALYDSFPRVVAPGANEDIPDPSGKHLGASDPRSILRRGAAHGFAEADFVGRDGLRYRARCGLARARGKATGNLQQRVRSLHRIDESGAVLAAVESGVEPVRARIVELTDLTFDQFRRTALLAQGDFDAFLRASSDERAALLEKITGASIYAEISKRAFQRAKEAAQAVERLEQRRDDIGVMEEEARAALVAEQAQGEARRAELSLEREAAIAALRRHEAIALAETRLEQAQAARDQAARDCEAIDATRAELEALRRAEFLRPLLDERRRTEAACTHATQEEARARLEAQKARDLFAADRAAEEEAEAALRRIESEAAALEPQWARARLVDSQIQAAMEAEAKARHGAALARGAARLKREASAAADAALQTALDELATTRDALLRLTDAKPLCERWAEIAEQLDKRAQFARDKDGAAKRLDELSRDLERGEAQLAALDVDDESDRGRRDALNERIAERAGALDALDEPAARRRAIEIDALAATLRALLDAARRHDDATAARRRAQADHDAAEGDAAEASRAAAALRVAREREEARREEVERLGDLADAAASQDALRLRAALIDGEACPVCGARDHPFSHSDDAANALVAQMRARRDALHRGIAQLDAELVAMAAREAARLAERTDAARRRDEADGAIAAAAHDYADAGAHWPQGVEGLSPPPAIDSALDALQSLAESIGAEREAMTKRVDAARMLRDEIETLRKSHDAARDAMETRRAEREGVCARLEGARQERATLQEKIANFTERLESLDRALAPFLGLCDLAPSDLARDAPHARARLEALGDAYRDTRDRLERLESDLQTLRPDAARLQAEATAALDAAREAQAAVAARSAEVSARRAERADLLDGEAADTHRARFDDRRSAALKAREDARTRRVESGEANAAAQQKRAGAGAAHAQAQEALEHARRGFAQALASAGMAEESASTLLAIAPPAQAEMRERVQRAEAALASAQVAVVARQKDLGEALAAGRPAESTEALASRGAELAAALETLARRLGEIGARLVDDDAARLRAQNLSAEIEATRAARKNWDEINDAIGSASGDKFRRFAQGLTLERLVALANQRLATLSPRYALERAAGEGGDLGLQIVDRELAGERRSTRSLSGGERFLASLALALALAGLEGRDSFVDTLFIDEGFGALDASTLDVAIDALETLQGQGRKVGVISHVDSLQQRIATQIRLEKRGGGKSVVRIDARAAAF